MIFGDDIDTFIDFAVAFGAFLGEIEWHGCSLLYVLPIFARVVVLSCACNKQKDL
jgi:hypothetical protein